MPDIDPIEEEVTSPSEAAQLHRQFSPENTEFASSSVSDPLFHQGFSPTASTSPQSHLSNVKPYPIQTQSLSEDSTSEHKPSIFTSNPKNLSPPSNIFSEDIRTENLAPKVVLTSEPLVIQKRPEIDAPASAPIQPKAAINPDDEIIQNHKLSLNINLEETTSKTIFPEGEISQERTFLGSSTSGSSLPKAINTSDNNIIQRNSAEDRVIPENTWPSSANLNTSFDLDNRTFSQAIIPDSNAIQSALDSQANIVENGVLSQELRSGKSLPNSMLDSQDSVDKQAIVVESKPIFSDLSTLKSNPDNFSVQRLSSPESSDQENNVLGVKRPNVKVNEDVQGNISHSPKEGQNLESSPNTEERHTSVSGSHTSTANQPQISRNLFTENTVTSAQAIQAKNVTPTEASTSQPTTRISPTPGMPAHTPPSHENLPVIVDFSTPPAPLQPQQMMDSGMAEVTNLLPETTEAEPFIHADLQRSEILFKPNLIQSEPSAPQHSHGVTESSAAFPTEMGLEHIENSPISTDFPETVLAEITPIQRASESNPTASVVNASDLDIESVNDEALIRSEDLAPKNLAPDLSQGSIKRSSLLLSEGTPFSAQNPAFPEISLRASDSVSQKIQRSSESRAELIADGPSSSTQKSPDPENVSEREQLSYQESQDHSERNTRISTEKTSSSAADVLTSTSSIDIEDPSAVSIQRDREEGSTLSAESLSTPTIQLLKTATSQNTESFLLGQPQQEIEVDAIASTDTASPLVDASLDTEISTRAQSTLPGQVQRTGEENSVPARDIESVPSIDTASTSTTAYLPPKMPLDIEKVVPTQIQKADENSLTSSTDLAFTHNSENLVDEPLVYIDQVSSFEQSQTIREASSMPPTNAAPIPEIKALESQPLAAAEEVSSSPIQKVNEDNPISSTNAIIKLTTEASLSKTHSDIETLIPEQIQKFDEARSTFTGNINSAFQTTNLVISEQPHIKEALPDQLQRASEEISVEKTEIVSASATTPLTQTPVDIEEAAPKQIQKANESLSTSSTDIASAHNLENFVNNPPINLDALSFDQNQTMREESTASVGDSGPIPTIPALEPQALGAAENLSSPSIPIMEGNYPEFLANVASETTVETLSTKTQPIIEGSIPEQIQKSSESSSTFSTDTNLTYQSDNLARETPTDIELSSPNNLQESNEESFPNPTIVESLSATINLDAKPVIIPENTSPEQTQRTSQADHSLTNIEFAPKSDLVSDLNLGAEPTRDLRDISSGQSQSMAEDDIISSNNNIPVSEPKALEPQLRNHIEGEVSYPIQRVADDNIPSSADTLSEAELTTSTFQEPARLKASSDRQIQNAFEENTNFLINNLSTSSKLDFGFELQTDIGNISDQPIQRTVEQDSTAPLDGYPESSTPHSIPKAVSNLQISPPNPINKVNGESGLSSIDNSSIPATPSSEFKSFTDHQETLSQDEKDSGDTSSDHVDFLSGTISKDASLDSQPTLNAESPLFNKVQKFHGEESTISEDLSSISSAPISVSEGSESEPLVGIEGSFLKQIQKTNEENDVDPGDNKSNTLSADLSPEFLSSIEGKTFDKVQKYPERYSTFFSPIISDPIKLPVDQQISVIGSENELTSLDLGSSSKLSQNHTVIQRGQQISSSDKALSLERIQLHRDPDPNLSLDHLSPSLTSFLSPEILPKYNDTPSNTIQLSRDTKSSTPVSSISSPAASTPRSDLWPTVVDNSSEAVQESSQAYLAGRPNSEDLLPDIIQKNSENKDVVEPDIISSTRLYSADSLSNFESVQPHNIQTPDVQGFDAGTVAVNAQVVNHHPMVISMTKAVLPSQIQRVNEINPFFSTDGETEEKTPLVDSIAADRLPQFQNVSFQNIQRTHASHFDNLTSLSTTNPEFSENENLQSSNQEQSSTQDTSISRFGDRTIPSSATSIFAVNALNPGDLFSAANASANSIQRLSEGISSFSSTIESTHSALGSPSSRLLKSEDLALDNSLERNVSAINATNPMIVGASAAQEQNINKHLDQHTVIHGTVKPLPTWPENLASSQDIGLQKNSKDHENLPILMDFQSPPRSLQRKPEVNQQIIENGLEKDTSIRREIEIELPLKYDQSSDQNQGVFVVTNAAQSQHNLDIAGIQLSSIATLPIQPHADLSDVVHHPETDKISRIPDTDPESIKQSWLRQQSESDLSKMAQPSQMDASMIQRLADDNDSVLPSEWQNLADLVASQVQDGSPKMQPTTWDRTEPKLSQEIVETSPTVSSIPLTTSSPLSTTSIQRRLSISRTKPVLKFRNPPAIQTQNTAHSDLSQPSFLIQAKEDTPFTTIEANQNRAPKDNADKSWALEQLAQEVYYRMRQRLMIEKERHGRLYDKRLK
ncbi:MAG: hypothetical protein ACHWZW_06310 [Spirulina sp.]